MDLNKLYTKEFTPNLSEVCKNKGISKAKLSRVMDYGDKTIFRWERDKNIPLNKMVELAKYIGITPSNLMRTFWQGEKPLFNG